MAKRYVRDEQEPSFQIRPGKIFINKEQISGFNSQFNTKESGANTYLP